MSKWKFWETPQPVKTPKNTYHSFTRPTSWNDEPDYNLSAPVIDRRRGRSFLPFGEDNHYPHLLLSMYHGSPFHAALLNFKTRAVIADGLEIKMNKVKMTLEDEITLGKAKTKLNRAFFKRFIQEFLIHERVYIDIDRKGDKGNNFKITPAEYVRVSVEEDSKIFYVNPDWMMGRYNEIYEIVAYDKYNTKDKNQLLEFQSIKPGFDGYAIPEYASANNWIWLDSEIAFFQKQNIANSINPSAVIKFYQDIANKEEKTEFIHNLKTSFTSAQNAGKIMVFFSNSKEESPDIILSEPNKLDKAFAGTQENIIKNVSYAHLVNPVLMGVATEGKLGSTNEINEAFALFQTIWLEDTQDTIEDYLNELVRIIDPTLYIEIKRKDKFITPKIIKENGES